MVFRFALTFCRVEGEGGSAFGKRAQMVGFHATLLQRGAKVYSMNTKAAYHYIAL